MHRFVGCDGFATCILYLTEVYCEDNVDFY